MYIGSRARAIEYKCDNQKYQSHRDQMWIQPRHIIAVWCDRFWIIWFVTMIANRSWHFVLASNLAEKNANLISGSCQRARMPKKFHCRRLHLRLLCYIKWAEQKKQQPITTMFVFFVDPATVNKQKAIMIGHILKFSLTLSEVAPFGSSTLSIFQMVQCTFRFP